MTKTLKSSSRGYLLLIVALMRRMRLHGTKGLAVMP
jgi:hypothetical protein